MTGVALAVTVDGAAGVGCEQLIAPSMTVMTTSCATQRNAEGRSAAMTATVTTLTA